MKNFFTASLISVIIPAVGLFAFNDQARWWPVQKGPKEVYNLKISDLKEITTPEGNTRPVMFGPEHITAQSIAGLAAQAVNDGKGNSMVWIELPESQSHCNDYKIWYQEVKKRLSFTEAGTKSLWELVDIYQKQGIIKGYVLYSHDYSKGPEVTLREGLDHSANAATVACSIEGGIMVSRELEQKAIDMGLKKLADTCGKDEKWAFEKYKNKLSRTHILAQDPMVAHHRDLAIAHKCMVVFGIEEPTPTVYKWAKPTAYLMGWNAPGEGEFVSQLSEYGHILLPSNWCMNLPILSSETQNYDIKAKFAVLDPEKIDYSSKQPAAAFIMSDGDNVQWLMGNFVNNPYYWTSKNHGDYPIGWPLPFGCLDQVCPETMEYIIKTQKPQTTFTLHAGGYYMPDLFGKNLPVRQREKLLREHARKVSYYMNKYGSRTYQFICWDMNSPMAQRAYKIFAEEIENLAGIFAIQYAPYEAGDGKVFWVTDKKGIEIPVLTCKYGIWANLNTPHCGTPTRIANAINNDAKNAGQQGQQYLNWAIIHAWSGFNKVDSNDEMAENAQYLAPGTEAGVTPTLWCVNKLDKNIKVVTPEELLWRLRMDHNPEQTQAVIKTISK